MAQGCLCSEGAGSRAVPGLARRAVVEPLPAPLGFSLIFLDLLGCNFVGELLVGLAISPFLVQILEQFCRHQAVLQSHAGSSVHCLQVRLLGVE